MSLQKNLYCDCAKFCIISAKTHGNTKYHVLDAIGEKYLDPTLFLEMVLEVVEGLTRGGYFPDSMFDPSATDHNIYLKHKETLNVLLLSNLLPILRSKRES